MTTRNTCQINAQTISPFQSAMNSNETGELVCQINLINLAVLLKYFNGKFITKQEQVAAKERKISPEQYVNDADI